MLEWLEGAPHAVLLQRSGTLYLFVNAAHIACMGLLIGAIVSLDLRMLGGFRTVPFPVIGPFLSRMAGGGLVLAMLTGFWLFSVKPTEYAANPAFLIKLGVIGLGLVNALWLHAGRHWPKALSDTPMPRAARAHAVASLLIWLGAVLAGRWIGFL